MACSNLFKFCCGEGEEDIKYGALLPADAVWIKSRANSNSEDDDVVDDTERIRRIEEKVMFMNRYRSRDGANNIRGTITCKPMDMADYCLTHQPHSYPKSEADMEFLTQVLRDSLTVVLDLDESELQLLCEALQQETVAAGTVIIRKGDIGDFYYVVDQGEVLFIDPDDDNASLGKAGRGEAFGEFALLYDAPRAVSCIASDEPVTLWKVDQQTFRYLLANHYQAEAHPLKDRIRKIEIFQGLDESVVSKFAESMTRIRWKEGDQIVVKGDVGNVFYIIEQGQVKIHDIGLGDSMFDDQILGPGESFGERALLTGEPRAANITAMTDVTTRAMDRETFERSIGSLQSVLERHIRRQYLASMSLFSQLSPVEIDQLVDLLVEVCYRKDEKLAEAGKPYQPMLWIIRRGRLLVFNTMDADTIYSLGSGDHFGDESIRYPGSISVHNAVCEEDLTAWVLTKQDIENGVWDIDRLSEPSGFSVSKQDGPLEVNDLIKVRLLGHGAFGKVWLVKTRDTATTSAFALKVISKRLIIESKQVQGVLREKQLLSLFHHQFIVHLVSAFQDSQNLYLLLPVVPGGELYSVLQKKKSRLTGLSNKSAAFYTACVLEALAHFHQRSVCYRDIKLENILVDAEGYCRIVDLGFAKVVVEKTFTLVGTPEYMAPEIIMSKGYDKACDLWSLGVLAYELVVGNSPFFDDSGSRMDMFKRIVRVQYDMPWFVTDDAKDFVRNLLVRRPTERLGNRARGHAETKNHPWFVETHISFKNIMAKTQEPPWKPKLSDPLNLTSFDDYSDIENEIDTSTPLTAEEQALFADF